MFRLMSDPSRLKIIVACLSVPIRVSDVAADEHVRCTISDTIAHVREDVDTHVREDVDAHVREDGDAHENP